jgi:hypothetical protein
VLRSAVGAWFYGPATQGAALCEYQQTLPPTLTAAAVLQPAPHWWRQIAAVAPYARISGVALTPGAVPQVARAVGVTCRVLLPVANVG